MALITTSKKRRVTFDLPDSDSEDSDSEEKENSLLLLRKQFYFSKKRSSTTQRKKRDPASPQAEVKLRSILKNANYKPCIEPPITSSFLPVEVINAIINSKLGSQLFEQVNSDSEEKSRGSPNLVFGKCNNANDSLNNSFDSEETVQENQATTNSGTDTSPVTFECKSTKNSDNTDGYFDFWSVIATNSVAPAKPGNFDSDSEDFADEPFNSNKGGTNFSIQSSRDKKEPLNNTRKFTNNCFNKNLSTNNQPNNLKTFIDKPIKKVLARISNSEAFKEVPELKPINNLSTCNNSIFSKDLENKRKENKFVNKKCSEDTNNNLELLENPIFKKLKNRTNLDSKSDNLVKVLDKNRDNKRRNSTDFGNFLEKNCASNREFSELNSKEPISSGDNNFSDLKTFSDNLTCENTNSDNTNIKLDDLDTACDNFENNPKNCFDFWDIIQSDFPVPRKAGDFDSDAEECQEEQLSRRNSQLKLAEQVLSGNENNLKGSDDKCLIKQETQQINPFSSVEKEQKVESISESNQLKEEENCVVSEAVFEGNSSSTAPSSINTIVNNSGEFHRLSLTDAEQDYSELANCIFSESNSDKFESQLRSNRVSSTDSCDSSSETSITESWNRKRYKSLKKLSKNSLNSAERETLANDSVNLTKSNSESKENDNKNSANLNKNNTLSNVPKNVETRHELQKEPNESVLRTNNCSNKNREDSASDFDFWSIIESDSAAPIKAGDFDSDADDFLEENSLLESSFSDSSDLSEESNESASVSRNNFPPDNYSNRKSKKLKKVRSKNYSKDSENKRKENDLAKDFQKDLIKQRVTSLSAAEINLSNSFFIENLETNSNSFLQNIPKSSFIELPEPLISSHPALLNSQVELVNDNKFTLDENSNIKNIHIKDLTAKENVLLEELPDYSSRPSCPEESPCSPVESPFTFETDLTIPVFENLINEFAASELSAKSLKSPKSRHSRHRSKSASRTSSNYPDTATTCKPNLLITLNLASFGSRIYSEIPDSPLSPSKRVIRPYTRKAPVKRTPSPSPTSPTPPNMGSENLYGLNCAGEIEILSPSKRDDIKEKDILIWIYNMIDEPARVDYEYFLKDGCILCKLMNRVKPGCIPEDEITWEGARSKQKNISNFLEQAEKYGVPKAKLFYSEDLLHLRHVPRVTRCLYALAKIAQDDPALGPDCPRIGDEPNFVDAAKKVFIPGHRDTKDVMNQLTTTIAKKEEKKTLKVSLYK